GAPRHERLGGREHGRGRERPAEQAGCEELDGLERVVLHLAVVQRVGGRAAGGRLVRRLDDRVHQPAHRSGPDLVGRGVVDHDAPSVLFHGPGHVALRHLAERLLAVGGPGHRQDLAEFLAALGQGLLQHGHLPDLHHRHLGGALVAEDRAEDDQERQGEQDGEEERRPVAPEPEVHGAGQALEALERAHALYSRPVTWRKTSSSVAPWIWTPSSASLAAMAAITAEGSRVVTVSETPSSAAWSAPGSACASSTVRAPLGMLILEGASRPRTSTAGGPSRRIRPASMMATRSQSTSASSM